VAAIAAGLNMVLNPAMIQGIMANKVASLRNDFGTSYWDAVAMETLIASPQFLASL